MEAKLNWKTLASSLIEEERFK